MLLVQFFFVFVAALYCASIQAKTVYVDQSLNSEISIVNDTYPSLSAAAEQLSPGDTLIIRPGVYRESLILEGDESVSKKGLTIKGSGSGQVIIKGSDVVVGWGLYKDDIYVKHGWHVQPQQVFVDGEALRQVGGTVFGGYPEDRNGKLYRQFEERLWPGRLAGSIEDMPGKSFKYESKEKALYLRLPHIGDIAEHKIEVGVRPFSLLVRGWDDVTVEDLIFQHSNTSTGGRNGVVSLWGNGHVLRKITILDADSVGLHLVGDNISVLDSEISGAGRLGVLARGANHLYRGNKTNHNNTRGFNPFWEAGGMKFVGSGGLKDSVVTQHEAIHNQGDGIWFDWFNKNNEITSSFTAYNQGSGIHYEASMGATISGNISVGNKHRGIYLPHSSNSVVTCNLAAFNGMEGIVVIDEGRRTPEGNLIPKNNRILGNVIAWNSKRMAARPGLVLPKVNSDNISNFNLFISEYPNSSYSLGWPKIVNPLIRGLEKWKKASGQDTDSWQYRMAVPGDMLLAIRNRNTNIDWSAFSAVVKQYAFPQPGLKKVLGCTTPGPFSYYHAYSDYP